MMGSVLKWSTMLRLVVRTNSTGSVDFHDGERVEMVYNVKVSCQDK